jgi:hypothetical protein
VSIRPGSTSPSARKRNNREQMSRGRTAVSAGFIEQTPSPRKRTVSRGVPTPGAVAEFPVRPERPIEIDVNDAAIEAQASDAHLRLTLHDKLRGLAFASASPIVLALPRNRATLPHIQRFTPLGVDRDAVGSRHRTHELFDLGLGRQC